MREALIVWGGWSGHEPEAGAHIVGKMLEEHDFKVYIEDTTEAFADPAIADMSSSCRSSRCPRSKRKRSRT